MSIRRLSELSLVASLAWLVAPGSAVAAPATAHIAAQAAPDDPMAEFRERFKEGMDRYKAGALAEAIGYWEPIYRQLGEQKGYRLAYNLGVAYAEQGDATRAAERLQTFLSHVDARRARGDALEPIVQKEEADARSRIATLTALKGRLQIEAGSPARAVQIDASEPRLAGFVAWVTPGEHTVTFAPGTPDAQTKRVVVSAGETLDVAPTPLVSAVPSATVPSPSATGSPNLPPPFGPAPERYLTARPFSPAVLVLTGILTVAGSVVAAKLDTDALARFRTLKQQIDDGMPVDDNARQGLKNQTSVAYDAVGVAVGLGVLTAGLTAWYFLGSSQREIAITPAGISGRF